MKKNNGFTLIELLAVIIILAIIALIATPIVLNVVEDARKSAAASEANLVISGVQNGCAVKDMQVQMGTEGAAACKDTLTETDVKELVNLGKAKVTTALTVTNNKVTAGVIESNGYIVTITDGTVGEPTKKPAA